jgi:hypothetical protein
MLQLHNKFLRNAAMQKMHMKRLPQICANIGKIEQFRDSPCTVENSRHLLQQR